MKIGADVEVIAGAFEGHSAIIESLVNGTKAEVRLDSGVKVVVNLGDLDEVEIVSHMGEKSNPPGPVLVMLNSKERVAMRVQQIVRAALDDAAIEEEKGRIARNIAALEARLREGKAQLATLGKVRANAEKHARRVARMRLSDAAAIAEVKAQPEVARFARKQ